MKIDIFAHIMPRNYLEKLQKKAPPGFDTRFIPKWESQNRPLIDMDLRRRVMDRYPGVLQVLTLAIPPLETVVGPADAVELAKIANDEMAKLVRDNPDFFLAAAACLPLNDIDASLKEIDRAVGELGLKGVQIFSTINGEPLSSPKFRPLYEKMHQYDLPLWIHPVDDARVGHVSAYGWPYETSVAMARLVYSGVLADYPGIKFITHHCGGMVPYFAGRVQWMNFNLEKSRVRNHMDYFPKFYNDTALYGNTPALMCGYAFFGADHILFGTDAPLGAGGYGHIEATIRSIERMEIADEEKLKIFADNAMRILKIPL